MAQNSLVAQSKTYTFAKPMYNYRLLHKFTSSFKLFSLVFAKIPETLN